MLAIDRVLDDPVGALSAHGVAGIWGTLACGLFASPRLVDAAGAAGRARASSTPARSSSSACRRSASSSAFVVVFTLSYLTFAAIKAIFGLRVTADEEHEGLDIVEHGMYGYPEQFIVGGEVGVEPAVGDEAVAPR